MSQSWVEELRDSQMLHRFLCVAAADDPDGVALTFAGRAYTYAELDQRANAVAQRLTAAGLGRGKRVAVVISNRPEWIICTQAVLRTGAAVITPLATWTRAELGHALELTAPDGIIAETQSAATLNGYEAAALRLCVDDDAGPQWTSIAEAAATRSADPVSVITDAQDEAFLLFSSGTTGLPKAVRHSHRSMSAIVAQWIWQAGIGPQDRVQFFMPAPTIFGMANTLACFAARARISFFQRFNLDVMLQDIQDSGITIAMAAAPIAVAMAAHPDLEKFDLSSLRYLVWGATPISKDVAAGVTSRTGVHWLHVYGTSEHGQLAANPVTQPDRWRLDSPGLMSPDVTWRFVGEDGQDVPAGTPGELWVQSPQAMLGYLPPESDADVYVGDWLRTGDVGYVDQDGFLYLVDRAKEMIKVSGFSVSPVEIERALFAHPDVDDCGVYPVPDDRAGHRPAVAIVRRPGSAATPEQFQDWIAERMSAYKRLSSVAFVDAIPRTASGKIVRRKLPDLVEQARVTTTAGQAGPTS
jgi:acyl-CoA synthetase (AMP-forming)/AMP-acid ligase II